MPIEPITPDEERANANENTGREDWLFVPLGEYTFATYATHARRTIRPDNSRELLLNGALGVTGEAAEIAALALANAVHAGAIADAVKKHVFHGKKLDSAAIIAEIGDVLWYLNEIALTVGGSLELAARANNAKLYQRFSGASFAEERAAAQADKAMSAEELYARIPGNPFGADADSTKG